MTQNDLRPPKVTGATDVVPSGGNRRRRRPRWRLIAIVLAAAVLLPAISIGRALAAPGTDTVAARLAEWGRGHGMSGLIDRLERATYTPPAVGGSPAANSPLTKAGAGGAGAAARAPSIGEPRHNRAGRLPTPLPVVPVAQPALPDEGSWMVVAAVGGQPAIREAFLRPDALHTSYTAGVAWLDASLLRFVLHPGTEEPGHGPWTTPPDLVQQDRTGLLAAFNGGFRMDAARGGFFADGRTVGVLRPGAASLVIDRQGRAQVGQWGRDVSAGPDVVAVRQNLDLLVDGGQVVPGLDSNLNGRWGATLGNKLYVYRSGIGQTSTGALVYVSGNKLSAATLADLLHRAGAVRAMELDINPEWTSFVNYPAEKNLLPDMQRSPHRYDTTSSRDFVAVLARSS